MTGPFRILVSIIMAQKASFFSAPGEKCFYPMKVGCGGKMSYGPGSFIWSILQLALSFAFFKSKYCAKSNTAINLAIPFPL